jgi:hypothetical protein
MAAHDDHDHDPISTQGHRRDDAMSHHSARPAGILPVHAQAQDPPRPDPRRWWALVLLCLAQFMVILDITVVNVALPTIGVDLHLDRTALTWVVTAYTLCFGSLMLLGGRLADSLGRRRTFLAGLGLFTAASLASGLARPGRSWSPPAPARASAQRCCHRRRWRSSPPPSTA